MQQILRNHRSGETKLADLPSLDKIKTDGLMPTVETVFKRLDEPLPKKYFFIGNWWRKT